MCSPPAAPTPNFPPIYWGGPAVHACFEGDVAALDALCQAGCNLLQRVEWLLQDAPKFSLVHAAAYNGQVEVLRYLRQTMPPSFFRECDAEGSNARCTPSSNLRATWRPLASCSRWASTALRSTS